ncbi:MAG: response regulator [Thiotrichales bacterium]|nr:response regulator [Thiotrichales bacterium]
MILLVDDDPALRAVVSFSLELAGYQVVEADSRQSAIDQLAKKSISVVILDMGMPPHEHSLEEGLAVLEWLDANQPQVKTLVLTGQDASLSSYQSLKLGAFDFLEKPISQQALLQSVSRAFLFFEQAEKLKHQEGIQRVEIDAILGEGVKTIRNQAEEKMLKQVLIDTDFNVHETGRRLGLKRENVYYLIKKYHIVRNE